MRDQASFFAAGTWAARRRDAQADWSRPGGPAGLAALAAQEGQGEVEPFDLTAPSFVGGALAPREQVGFHLVEPGQHGGRELDGRHWDEMPALAAAS